MTTSEITALAAIIATVLVSLINAIATYRTGIANNKHQLTQLQAQWEHEQKKGQIESDATKERYTKERLQDIYANAASSLSEIMTIREYSYSPKDLADRMGEAQKWLSLMIVYYYGDREDTHFHQFYTEYSTNFSKGENADKSAEYLRRCVIAFAVDDPRLK